MTIALENGCFVARCEKCERGGILMEGVSVRRRSAQSQESLAIDTSPPGANEALHGDDGTTAKREARLGKLTKIEQRELDRFVAELRGNAQTPRRDRWAVRVDRSLKPFGLSVLCWVHNPATVWPRPPPDLDY